MNRQFFSYAMIGILNTGIHWTIFLLLMTVSASQSLANLAGYIASASFSFFANARWTFKSDATTPRYLGFMVFMGALSWAFGKGADLINLYPLMTLIGFSALSLVLGFLFSRFCIFRSAA
ncbi:GtrA family protein [Kushneria sp. Sum13]|uniref:GtrA family protein n=1 Tax=Kushneria sp. Sum13 TaxID=3459196 RepID=UPI004045C2FB